MAGPWFVDSAAVADGLGGGNAGTAANPWLLLSSVTSGNGVAAGDTIWVASTHAESTAGAVTCTFPGTSASPNFFYCVPAAKFATPPGSADLTTGASVTTTLASDITLNGFAYFYGIQFTAGNLTNAANIRMSATDQNRQTFENCKFILGGTGTGSIINASSTGGYTTLINSTLQFSAVGHNYLTRGTFIWKNTPNAIQGATIPTTLFNTGAPSSVTCDGVDFSALSGSTLFPSNPQNYYRCLLKDCLLPASITIAAETGVLDQVVVDIIRTDASGAGNTYRVERHISTGDMTTSATIYRTGGASDGTVNFSRVITTPATRVQWIQPFAAPPIAIWNDTTGSRNVTIQATSNIAAGGFPNNDEIWIEVSYLGSATTPLASFATNTKANNLAVGSAYNGTGAGSWNSAPTGGAFVMTLPSPITVNQKGFIYVTVKCAKTSTIFYVDPLIVLS